MLSNALTNLLFAPYLAVTPGVFITLAVFSFSVLGDSLRDVLDPRPAGADVGVASSSLRTLAFLGRAFPP